MQGKPIFRKIDRGGDKIYMQGPAVLQIGKPRLDEITGYVPIVSVQLNYDRVSKAYSVMASGVYRVREYELKSINDFKFMPTLNKITFEFQGTMYTVRPFKDEDGHWASSTEGPVPSDILEDILVNSFKAEIGEENLFMNESLTALTDETTGEVVYLLYTGAKKTFTRKGGEWLELHDPKGELLDGLNLFDVVPAFVKFYDEKNGKVSEKDINKFEMEMS